MWSAIVFLHTHPPESLKYFAFKHLKQSMEAILVFGLTPNSFVKETSIFSMWQKTPKYCSFFVGSNSLYGSSYMSSCPRQLHYSWQLKHYSGPHNHRAVHMIYCLFAPCSELAPLSNAMSPYGSRCLDFRRLLGNPLSQVYICHDSGLTRGRLLCPAARRR